MLQYLGTINSIDAVVVEIFKLDRRHVDNTDSGCPDYIGHQVKHYRYWSTVILTHVGRAVEPACTYRECYLLHFNLLPPPHPACNSDEHLRLQMWPLTQADMQTHGEHTVKARPFFFLISFTALKGFKRLTSFSTSLINAVQCDVHKGVKEQWGYSHCCCLTSWLCISLI